MDMTKANSHDREILEGLPDEKLDRKSERTDQDPKDAIILIEDNKIVREMLCRKLRKKLPENIFEFEDLKTALDLINEYQGEIRIIIVDLGILGQVPDRSELLRDFRKKVVQILKQPVPIIATTGRFLEPTERAAADESIKKPFFPNKLISAIERLRGLVRPISLHGPHDGKNQDVLKVHIGKETKRSELAKGEHFISGKFPNASEAVEMEPSERAALRRQVYQASGRNRANETVWEIRIVNMGSSVHQRAFRLPSKKNITETDKATSKYTGGTRETGAIYGRSLYQDEEWVLEV